MSAAPPLLLNLQGARRRLLYVTLFEGLAIAIVTLALLVFTGAGAASAGGLAIGSSAIALGWNLVFNMLFERWERRQPTRGRSAARRVAHAIGFEGGLLLFLVPFFAWWLGVSLWQALVLDIGFLLFFLVYNFVFAWAFDRLFGLPAGVGVISRVSGSGACPPSASSYQKKINHAARCGIARQSIPCCNLPTSKPPPPVCRARCSTHPASNRARSRR